MDPFIKPKSEYVRCYDLKETYLSDSALYLSKMAGIDLEQARQFVEQLTAPNGAHPIKAPMARILQRDKNGDRQKRQVPFDQLLDEIRQNQEILAPNLTAYTHPSKRKSLLAKYIAGNLQKRNEAKHAQFAAERAGDYRTMEIMKSAQTTFKIKNNSLSGAHSSPYTILWNKSSHSTLTSGCRTATSYGNANNERFLYGNRHYWSPTITLNNLISIINHSDRQQIRQCMEQYQLQYPTVDQVMQMIERSTRSYWRDAKYMSNVRQLVERMDEIERAAVLFTGDLYHLAQVNPVFVKRLLKDFSSRTDTPIDEAQIEAIKAQIDGDMISFISMLCPDQLFNPETGKYEAMKEVKRPHARGILYANGQRILSVLETYQRLIQTFWVTDNLPSSVYYLPNIMRHGVIASDTDSTIFSVSYWPIWYTGSEEINEESMAIAATMIYLTSKIIIHILARFSANCGVAEEDIHRLSMKNEYFFPVFSLTSRAKHYFAYISMQEGTMKLKKDTEIKGVALRNSNVPPEITKKAKALMCYLMDQVLAGKKISLLSVLRTVALIEHQIKQQILNGDFRWLRRIDIKPKHSYKDQNQNNFRHYEIWQDVFSRKYGQAPQPPYKAVAFSLTTDSKLRCRQWLASIEDRAIATALEQWLSQNGKDSIATLYLPESVLQVSGIPKELLPVIDLRNILAQTMESFYLILESLGFFIKDQYLSKLLSDHPKLIEPDSAIPTIALE